MTATTSCKLGTSRLLTAVVGSQTATGPPGNVVPGRDTTYAVAGAGLRPVTETAFTRGERAASGLMRWIRDGIDRRRTVRELRRMGRSRLVDIGIDPDGIERVVDAMLTTRRDSRSG